MDLKKFVAAAALGATVLTAVPALVAPHEASASACDQLTECGNGPGDDNTGWGDGWGGDWASVGSSGATGGTVTFPQVVVIGHYEYPALPADPGIPPIEWNAGYTGGVFSNGSADYAVAISAGAKGKLRQPCIKNNNSAPLKLNQSSTYKVSYKTSANLSASAKQVLTASIGHELNTEYSTTLGFEVVINPGNGFALDVEYQTMVYEVTTTNVFGQSKTEYAHVVQPTGALTAVSC